MKKEHAIIAALIASLCLAATFPATNLVVKGTMDVSAVSNKDTVRTDLGGLATKTGVETLTNKTLLNPDIGNADSNSINFLDATDEVFRIITRISAATSFTADRSLFFSIPDATTGIAFSGSGTVAMVDGALGTVTVDSIHASAFPLTIIGAAPDNTEEISIAEAGISLIGGNYAFNNDNSFTLSTGVISYDPDTGILSIAATAIAPSGGWLAAFIPTIFPDTTGHEGQVLGNDGSGTMLWQAANPFNQALNTTDEVTFAKVNGITINTGTGTLDLLSGSLFMGEGAALTIGDGATVGLNGSFVINGEGSPNATLKSGGTIVTVVDPPAAATDPGLPGSVAFDDLFIYRCTATDTWVRTPVVFATW